MLMKNRKPPHQDLLDLGFTEDQANGLASRFAELTPNSTPIPVPQWLFVFTLSLIIAGIAGLYGMHYNAQIHTANSFAALTASFHTRIDQTEATLQERIDYTKTELLAAITANQQSIAENRNDITRIKTILEERLPPRTSPEASSSSR